MIVQNIVKNLNKNIKCVRILLSNIWEYVRYLHQKNKLTTDINILKEPREKAKLFIEENEIEMEQYKNTYYS